MARNSLKGMLVLDSAGVQSTVSKKSPMVDSILDARTTESLMFDMISRTLAVLLQAF